MITKALLNLSQGHYGVRHFSTVYKSGMGAKSFDSGFPKHKEMFNDEYYSNE
jgi:hypothetical protein